MTPSKPLVGSYTLLNTYEICPHQAYRRMVAKDIPFVETPEMKHGIAVHEGMEKRLKKGTVVFPEYEAFAAVFSERKPEAEMKVGITADGSPSDFFGGEVWFRGKIDVVAVQGTSAFIGDWKTGKLREDPHELEIFSLMLKAKRPELQKITGSYLWLKEMKVGKAHDLSDWQGTWTRLKKRMGEIKQSQESGHWPKQQGPLCGWCSVKDCEFNRNAKL